MMPAKFKRLLECATLSPRARTSRIMRMPAPYDRLMLPVYIPSLLMSTSQMALMILLPIHIVDIGFSAAFAATVVGLRGIGLLAFDVPAGMLVARFGDRAVLLGGQVLIVAGTLLLALTSSVIGISLAAVLIGAGFSAWMLGRQSYIADVCENHEVGRAIAGMAGLQRVGIFIGPAAGALLAARFGFNATFLAGAAIAALAGLFVLAFTRSADHQAGAESVSLRGMAALLAHHSRIFATAGMAALALQLMRATRQLLVPLVGQAAGLDVIAIGTIYSLSAGIDMSLFYPVGVIVDRWGRKWSAVPSMLLFAAGRRAPAWSRKRSRHGNRHDHRRRPRAADATPRAVPRPVATVRRLRHGCGAADVRRARLSRQSVGRKSRSSRHGFRRCLDHARVRAGNVAQAVCNGARLSRLAVAHGQP
jgi:MFS family permease